MKKILILLVLLPICACKPKAQLLAESEGNNAANDVDPTAELPAPQQSPADEQPSVIPPEPELDSAAINHLIEVSGVSQVQNVTHVAAVDMEGNMVTSAVATSDQSFKLTLENNKIYEFVFVCKDGTRTGTDMIAGVFAINGLTALPIPAELTSLDLGNISDDGAFVCNNTEEVDFAVVTSAAMLRKNRAMAQGMGGPAIGGGGMVMGFVTSPFVLLSSDKDTNDLLSKLQMTSDLATILGALDNFAFSRVNPDKNYNGDIDSGEAASNLYLETSNSFWVKNGTGDVDIIVANLKNQYFPQDSFFSLQRAGLSLIAPTGIFNSSIPENISFIFESFVEYDSENAPCNQTTDPGFEVQATKSTLSTSNKTMWTKETCHVPDGSYTALVNINNESQTFTFPAIPGIGDSDFPDKFHFFVKINTDSNDNVTGIDYKWMKQISQVDATWQPASVDEVKAVVKENSAYADLFIGDDHVTTGKKLHFIIPTSAAAGTISLASAQKANISEGQIAFDSLRDLSFVYQNKIGQMFSWTVLNEEPPVPESAG